MNKQDEIRMSMESSQGFLSGIKAVDGLREGNRLIDFGDDQNDWLLKSRLNVQRQNMRKW